MLAKKEKDAIKKALKRERKTFRATCRVGVWTHNAWTHKHTHFFAKQQNGFYASSEDDVTSKMADMERLCEALSLEMYVYLCVCVCVSM